MAGLPGCHRGQRKPRTLKTIIGTVNLMSNSNDALMYLERMDIGLKDRSPEITLWENYAEGIQRQQFNTTRFRSVFGNLYQALTDNWVKLE